MPLRIFLTVFHARGRTIPVRVAALCLFTLAAPEAALYESAQLGYSLQLPEGFSPTGTGAEGQEVFADPTGSAGYELSVHAFPYAAEDFPGQNAWTRYHFQVYLTTVRHSVYPFGAVAFLDSTSTATLDGNWAPEAYSEFFFTDATPTRAEYLRYTATPRLGYEIVAYGDSSVFEHSVAFIADSVIATFRAENTAESLRLRLFRRSAGTASERDPLGRLRNGENGMRGWRLLPGNAEVTHRERLLR